MTYFCKVNQQNLLYFIKLCRPVNLLIIGLTMYLMHYKVVGLIPEKLSNDLVNIAFPIHAVDFFLLVFSTILIAGAGYIINDYFDIRIDRINKPEKVIVGKYIKKRVAMLTHTFMNLIAVLIGLYLSFKYHTILPIAFHIVTTTLLWWYSVQLKKKFLSGNLVIAVLSGMVPLLVGWLEIPALEEESGMQKFPPQIIIYSWLLILGFSIMAATTTLIREIIKDMADIKGDESQSCKTIPIVLGIEKTKYIVIVLLIASVTGILAVQFIHFPDMMNSFYTITFVCMPLAAAAVITHYSKTRERFILAGNFIKISMLAAILFTFLIHA